MENWHGKNYFFHPEQLLLHPGGRWWFDRSGSQRGHRWAMGSEFWEIERRAARRERPLEDSDPRWWMKNHLGKKSGKDSARGKELLIMTKGTAVQHRAYKRRGPKKGRAISYFNQIISRTMGPTGEKSSFASCFWFGRRSLPSWRVALTERGCKSTLKSKHCESSALTTKLKGSTLTSKFVDILLEIHIYYKFLLSHLYFTVIF